MELDKKFRKNLLYIFGVFIFAFIFIFIISMTGFLQADKIDKRDLAYWNYTSGFQNNSSEFEMNGSKETCWLLVHSYTSTPNEMAELGEKINSQFGDYVYTPLLLGHGQTPSKILDLSAKDWYFQIEKDFEILDETCEKVNVVGSSIGGSVSLKLAEEKEFNNLYLVNSFLFLSYKFYYIFKPEFYVKILESGFHYIKKSKIAQINSKNGRDFHIAYWNMPLLPLKNSNEFLNDVENNLFKINENVLIQHSVNDETSSIKSSRLVFEKINSTNKKLIEYEKSNHLLLEDYDKEDVINEILEFEILNR